MPSLRGEWGSKEAVVVSESIHPEVRIGHAHLRVVDLRRATDFYHDVLGFDITLYGPDTGLDAASLSAGATITTSASTPGTAPAGHRLLRVIPACTISPSSTPTGGNWRRPSSAC